MSTMNNKPSKEVFSGEVTRKRADQVIPVSYPPQAATPASGKAFNRAARFITWVLRHAKEGEGVVRDREGWVRINDLLTLTRLGKDKVSTLARKDFDEIVRTDSKQRLEVSPDGQRVRAAQGHSVEVDLSSLRATPPAVLFHGTATQNLDAIRRSGIVKGRRQHVHLSADRDTAFKVGARHGTPVILPVKAGSMADRYVFLLASNGVWLCHHVPPELIDWEQISFNQND